MGDFNAKGRKEDTGDIAFGIHVVDKRNEESRTLADFAVNHQLKIMNTFFGKKVHKKWTRISPSGATYGIDFIITNNHNIMEIQDVFTAVNVGSDHSLVKAEIK